MSWANKVHKQRQVDGLMRKLEQHPDFKKYQQSWTRDATYRSYSCFVMICCDYLFRTFRCRKAGIKKFLKFAISQFKYIEGDEEYFKLLNDALNDEVGIDVLEMMQAESENLGG
jgi:hypothetical protein